MFRFGRLLYLKKNFFFFIMNLNFKSEKNVERTDELYLKLHTGSFQMLVLLLVNKHDMNGYFFSLRLLLKGMKEEIGTHVCACRERIDHSNL